MPEVVKSMEVWFNANSNRTTVENVVVQCSREERIKIFGYDPDAKLGFIGESEKAFPYKHRDGNTYSDKFEFYYNKTTGGIDVCHSGCNGTIFRGNDKDGVTTFQPPRGYPSSDDLVPEFIRLRDKYLAE